MYRIFPFLAILSLVFLACTLVAKPPNIIYIIADDAGYGDIGCYGQEKFETPRIDQLAKEGMRFTQHYSGATVCAPSRCSLMTGLHTGHCFVRGNKEVRPIGQHPLPAEIVTMAEIFQSKGYATGAFGKWGLGSPGSEGDPIHQGFDRFYGYNCQRNAHTYYPTWLFNGLEKVDLDGKTYSTPLIMEECLDFIRDNVDEPFFCFVPHTIPHAAMHAPDEYVQRFEEQFSEYAEMTGRYARTTVKNPVARFAAMMTIMDEDVGKILDLLKELKIDENTLVMFTSDNGPHKEGGHKPDIFDSNGPLSGYKRSLTEGGIRVPFIARWPGTIEAGTTSDHISAFWDMLPTVCDLIGAETPENLDGISMVPELMGKPQPKHDYLYWEFHEQGGKRAVRQGKWKAVQRNVQKDRHSPVMLFNLDKDIGEKNDLAKKMPKKAAEMKALMEEAHKPSEIFRFKWEQAKK